MQFLFGSDRDNGYGILYTDGKQNEADQIKDRISIPSNITDVDVMGFAPFDSNNNRPLFYRIKNDTDYPRGAYFIHGIYRDKNPGYYKGSTCLSDLFARFMDQATVNSIRSGEKISEGIETDRELLSQRSQFKIDPNILLDILTHIYQGDKIIISVRDDVFSVNYARVLISYVFDYLTPSLKKSCSFVTGNISSADLSDAAIRIVPASCAVSDGCAVIDATALSHVCTIDSEFVSIVKSIITASPESREVLFDNYELLFNGSNSMYLPRKFLDFVKASSGDAVVCEKISDNYLNEVSDPSQENVPAFIIKNLEGKYNSPENAGALLTLSGESDAFDPAAFLANNSLIIKKIYVFSKNASGIITDAFHRVFAGIEVNSSNVNYINEKINNFRKGIKEDLTKYETCYFRAVDAAVTELKGRVDLSEELYKRAHAVISSGVARQGGNIENPKQFADNLMSQCNEIFRAARSAGINIETKIMDDTKKIISENNKKFPGTPSGGTKESLTGLNNLSAGLMSKNDVPGIMDRMSSVVDNYAEFDKIVDFYAAKYAVKAGESLKNGAEPAFNKIGDPVRIKQIAAETALVDPVAAIYLLAAYVVDDARFIAADIVEFVAENYKAFDRISDADLDDALNKITGLVMSKAMSAGGDTTADSDVDSVLCRYVNDGSCYTASNIELTGKSLNVIDAVIKAWASAGHAVSAKIKIKAASGGSSAVGVILAGVVGLVVGALVATFVFNPGLFGMGKKDDSAATTTAATTESVASEVTTDEEDTSDSETTTAEESSETVGTTDEETDKEVTTEETTEATTEETTEEITIAETDGDDSDVTGTDEETSAESDTTETDETDDESETTSDDT